MGRDATSGDDRTPPAPGLLPADGPTRQMLRHRSVVMGGLRALLMQAVHPAVAAAIESSGTYHRDPWGRHARTVRSTLLILLGAEDQALGAVRRVNRMHRAVALGRDHPDKRAHPAMDPNLLLWVYAGLVSSFLLFEEMTVGLLDQRARERACQELAGVGILLGIPRNRVPVSTTGLDRYLTTVVQSGVLRPTESSRKLLGAITQDAPLLKRAKLSPAVALSLGTLPSEILLLYGRAGQRMSGSRRVTAASRVLWCGNHLLPGRLRYVNHTDGTASGVQTDLLLRAGGAGLGRP